MGRPVSIRRSLLVSIVAMMGLLSAAIIVVATIGARRAVDRLSGTIIVQTTERVEERLHRFFDPVDGGLRIAEAWGGEGMLDLERPQVMRALFASIMNGYEKISASIVADDRGREFMLMRIGEQWTTRELRPEQWGRRARFTEWTGATPEPVVSWREIDYDPRSRPWFRGALAAGRRAIHWTAPYTFFTTRQPGITAAVTYEDPAGDGVRRVIAFDVMLSEISDFTYGLRPSPNGAAFVMTYQGRVIGLPHDEQFADPAARQEAMLRQSSDLGLQVIHDGATASMKQGVGDRAAYRFESEGRTWWAGVKPFELGPDRLLLMAVAVPDDDLLGPIRRQRLTIVLVTVCVLAGALWRAIVLARRFSRPVEQLVDDSVRMSRGDLEPGRKIVSKVVEVRRLARAHERMRIGLQNLMKLERDLQLARQIQQGTFPVSIPSPRGFTIDAWSEPADETGGDTYDVVEHGEKVVLLLADATGHGIGPAISVTQFRAMLRMAVHLGSDPATILHHLNAQLIIDLPDGRFITAWLGAIDPAAGTLTSFSAGQGPILRFDAATGECAVRSADTVPLGVIPDLEVEMGAPDTLAAGDIVAVISDGIYECVDADGAQFGTERVRAVITSHADRTPTEIIAALRQAVATFTGEVAAADDRTGIVIKKEPDKRRGRRSRGGRER